LSLFVSPWFKEARRRRVGLEKAFDKRESWGAAHRRGETKP